MAALWAPPGHAPADFVQVLLYLGILYCHVFAMIHVVIIRNYGFGKEHYCMFICDCMATRIFPKKCLV